MQYRGLILLIFGASLIMSPLAVHLVERSQSSPPAAQQVVTQGARDAACDAASLDTPSGRLGCQRQSARTQTRRIGAGGALFVAARN